MRVIAPLFREVIRMREETSTMITGANGFVGRAVLRALRLAGRPVIALGERPCDAEPSEQWARIDLLDPAAVEAAMAQFRPQRLIHAAWARSRAGGLWDAPENADWRDASLALFDSFWRAGGDHVVACGTCAEYGSSAAPCHESNTPIAPASPYGKAKAELFERASSRASERGRRLAWARLFYLFGPHEAAARLVPSVIDSLLAGRCAKTGSGITRRDFAFVHDIGEAIAALSDTGVSGAYNVASGHGILLTDLVARIGTIMERPDLLAIGALPDRPGEAAAITADVRKIRRDTGWCARTSLDDALRQTIDWRRSAR